MSAERYTGQLYLAKSKPTAKTAHDGTFSVVMLAYSRPRGAHLVPWRIAYFGDDALGFWCQNGSDLTAGTPLQVDLTGLMVIEGGGRNQSAEIHAHINSIQVLPKAARSLKQQQ
jgi:hypothetical protein